MTTQTMQADVTEKTDAKRELAAQADAIIAKRIKRDDRRGNYTPSPLTGKGTWLASERKRIGTEYHRLNSYDPRGRESRLIMGAVVATHYADAIGQENPVVGDEVTRAALKLHRQAANAISARLTRLAIVKAKGERIGMDLDGGKRRDRLAELRARLAGV